MHKNHSYLFIPLILAICARIFYLLLDIHDFWGDSYHNWLISSMTLDNNWVYTDYKGRELVWLPFYRYLVAGVMYVFPNMDGFQLATYLNTAISIFTVGFLTYKIAQIRNTEIAIRAGIVIALLPWYAAYSTMNIPAIFAGLLLLVVVLQVMGGKWYWVALLTMIGVLTRYEITYLLMVVGLYTLWVRDWKNSAALLVGALVGLSMWSFWSHINTGNILYWISAKSDGLSWDAFFQTVMKGDDRTIFDPFLSIIQVLPILLVLVIPRWIDQSYKTWNRCNLFRFLPLTLVLFQLVFLSFGQYFYFSGANPRYFIILIPIGVYAVFSLIRDDFFKKKYVTVISIAFGLLLLIGQFGSFYYIGETWEKFAKTGEFIKNLESTNNYWIDEPAIIYHSTIPLTQIYSSDQLVQDEWNKKDEIRDNIISKGIQYIISFDASYSKTLWIWPEMQENDEFVWEKMKFEPVYRYSTEYQEVNNIHESLMEYVQSKFGPVTVWKVTP